MLLQHRRFREQAIALARQDLKMTLHVDGADISLPGQLGIDLG